MAKLAPSVLGADFTRLGEDIADCTRLNVDLLHLDIMDGHFVPNISFGPAIVKTINGLTDRFLDVHLMLAEPEKYFEAFAKAGADLITFHLEVHPDPVPVAKQLRDLGVQTGLSINPDKPVEEVLPYLKHFDLLLLMSVFPGFGGQKFIGETIPKIETARSYIDSNNLSCEIEVDGGIDGDNAATVSNAGADILVMGTGFFGSNDRAGLTKMVQGL